MKKCYILFCFFTLLLIVQSCTKFVEVDPPITFTNGENAYATDEKANSVLIGIYTNLSRVDISSYQLGLSSTSLYTGLSSDELTLHNSGEGLEKPYPQYYRNTLTENTLDFWSSLYKSLFAVNSAIEGLTQSTSLTPAVKQQLLGESHFLRGLYYFYLVNLYGDVPLVLGTDYTVNASLPRAASVDVYATIITDLREAQNLLSNTFLDASVLKPSDERVRPTKGAATALLSRVYLYNKDWNNAITESTRIISDSAKFVLLPIAEVFLKNNKEAIWQLQPVNFGQNTPDAWSFIIPSTGPDFSHFVYLSDTLVNSFEEGDLRKQQWINSLTLGSTTWNYAYKYKSATFNDPVTEYSTVLRVAEQYLIRAEASAQLNNIENAQSDLNKIRSRANLPATAAADQASLLAEILHERQVELFTEWGHRWFDLKRTGTINTILTAVAPAKGTTWNPNQHLFPIPLKEIRYNNQLTQNSGY